MARVQRRHAVSWPSVSVDVEPVDTGGPLYYAIVYKGLEHPWILVPMGVLEPTPCKSQGMTVQSHEIIQLWNSTLEET